VPLELGDIGTFYKFITSKTVPTEYPAIDALADGWRGLSGPPYPSIWIDLGAIGLSGSFPGGFTGAPGAYLCPDDRPP
jgi:hypothetical protein